MRSRRRAAACSSPSAIGRAVRSAKSSREPSSPGFVKWSWLQSSSRRFSTGVPESVTRKAAASRCAARATWLSGFLIVWASSRITVSQLICVSALGVQTQDRVAGEGHVRFGIELAVRAVVERRAQARPEARDLLAPVEEHAGGRHHQRAPAQGAEGLQGLAEAHVVGEHAAQPGVAQEAEPVDARPLVGAQLGAQVGGERGVRERR